MSKVTDILFKNFGHIPSRCGCGFQSSDEAWIEGLINFQDQRYIIAILSSIEIDFTYSLHSVLSDGTFPFYNFKLIQKFIENKSILIENKIKIVSTIPSDFKNSVLEFLEETLDLSYNKEVKDYLKVNSL